jgi:hypothetical protein
MRYKLFLILSLPALLLASCASVTKRRSAEYYLEHKKEINEVKDLYTQLYAQQPFSAGFTDRSFKYYVMEVTTDSVRYIYNTEKNEPQVYKMISRFKYDTTKLRSMSVKMKDIECLWLSKSSFFSNEKKDSVTYLSFRSANNQGMFVENKYYILIFLNHPINTPAMKARLKRGDLFKIDELVYFTIGSKFR